MVGIQAWKLKQTCNYGQASTSNAFSVLQLEDKEAINPDDFLLPGQEDQYGAEIAPREVNPQLEDTEDI